MACITHTQKMCKKKKKNRVHASRTTKTTTTKKQAGKNSPDRELWAKQKLRGRIERKQDESLE